ncbi:MAG: NAD(P)H-dependent oxidoreductase subunit E [Chloroflexi bacterium]|nr:NAD(P)H-dependent oxidoreductase subunit E [Chloroflexota bacterium]
MNEILGKYKEEVDAILAKYPQDFKRSAVLPLLYIAQREQGYVTREAMAEIADIVGISTTDVASIAGFYSLFYETPQGTYHIQVCNDLPCALRGANEFLKQLCEYLGVEVGETTADGLFTVEAVKCLAACHRAPMFQVQEGDRLHYHENQTIETAKAWIEEIRQQAQARAAENKDGGQQ